MPGSMPGMIHFGLWIPAPTGGISPAVEIFARRLALCAFPRLRLALN
jgi:hypothetical protein